jgi:cell division protein FtsQ
MSKRNRKLRPPEEQRAGRRRWLEFLVWWPLRGLMLAGLGAGLGAGAYTLTYYLRTSPALSVRCIEVHGTRRASRDDLLRLAGLSEGANVFAVDLAVAERRLERHPWVSRAVVRRVVPDRLVVEIEEHAPAALVSLEAVYVADPHGRLFMRLQPGDGLDLPVLTGFGREEFREEPARVERALRAGLALASAAEATACLGGRRVAEVHHDELMGFSLVLDPGAVSVRLGREDPADRLPWLCRLLEDLERRRLTAHNILLDQGERSGFATVRVEGLSASELNDTGNPG